MELDLWIGDDSNNRDTLIVQESSEGVLFALSGAAGPGALLTRAEVRMLYLSLKYWYDLGEDN